MDTYKCPNCKAKIPLDISVLVNKKQLNTVCQNCNKKLKASNPINWNIGFIIGFISFGIPSQLYLYFDRNFILAVTTGLISFIIAIIVFIIYIYKTTVFIEDN